ncbi:MAG: hypothetical protein Unbinned202contig1002_30 [Prokaryotic dsDNA virus sp.]|nr:MAG: hypothetical protein Unbinned202contig1002_30 [Prokaryotic dsDNA virus sp.]|tara:strand:+ start:13593 stop:13922 length:330 start_codon:yes stop_codon:yes gene_type:complete
MSFYNTINESGNELKNSNQKARSQEDLIYSYFLTAGKSLSPSQILETLKLKCPITSVRRALTNLTNEEKLVKTDDYVQGGFGKKEHLWRLRTAQDDIDPNQYTLFGGKK